MAGYRDDSTDYGDEADYDVADDTEGASLEEERRSERRFWKTSLPNWFPWVFYMMSDPWRYDTPADYEKRMKDQFQNLKTDLNQKFEDQWSRKTNSLDKGKRICLAVVAATAVLSFATLSAIAASFVTALVCIAAYVANHFWEVELVRRSLSEENHAHQLYWCNSIQSETELHRVICVLHWCNREKITVSDFSNTITEVDRAAERNRINLEDQFYGNFTNALQVSSFMARWLKGNIS